jgi:hypothetical protein
VHRVHTTVYHSYDNRVTLQFLRFNELIRLVDTYPTIPILGFVEKMPSPGHFSILYVLALCKSGEGRTGQGKHYQGGL